MSETLLGGLLCVLVGASGGYYLRVSRDKWQAAKVRALHFAALRAEIQYCGKLAGTFVETGIASPLYRFPQTVYEVVYPNLVSEGLSNADVTAFTGFYSQVEQMNRGLDAIDRLRTTVAGDPLENALFICEYGRLREKAKQMRHPTHSSEKPSDSEFYQSAIAAIDRHRTRE